MRILTLAFRHCLPRTAAATLVAIALAALPLLRDHAASPWLQLPPFAAALACCLAIVGFWPLFARQRPGADFVRRCTGRPLHGCAFAAVGALLALFVVLVPLGCLAGLLVLPPPYVHSELVPAGRPLFDSGDVELRFPADGRECSEVRLRPVVLLPKADPVPTRLQVLADGEPLAPEPIAVAGTRQLVRVPCPGRRPREFSVRRLGGNLPLLFLRDSMVAVGATPRSGVVGGVVTVLTYLVPTAVTLSLATLFGSLVALPVAFALAGAALLLQTLGQLGPVADALTMATRGHWPAVGPLFRNCLPSLGTAMAAMIGAMVLRTGLRR